MRDRQEQAVKEYDIALDRGQLYFYKHGLQLGGPFATMDEANQALQYHMECAKRIRCYEPVHKIS